MLLQQQKKIRSLSTDRENLRRFLDLIESKSAEAAELQILNFEWHTVAPELLDQKKQAIRLGYKIFLTVNGNSGHSLYGGISDVFDSPNFPSLISSVFLNTENSYRHWVGVAPRNAITLFLDFSRPGACDFSLAPSAATANNSNLDVRGMDGTWVNGVFSELERFIINSPSQQNWIHRYSIYDLLVWGLGFPFGFWISYKASLLITRLFAPHTFLMNAASVYAFFAGLVALRALFQYARWIWPLVEFRSERDKALRHRAFFAALALGIFCSVSYDLLKYLFGIYF